MSETAPKTKKLISSSAPVNSFSSAVNKSIDTEVKDTLHNSKVESPSGCIKQNLGEHTKLSSFCEERTGESCLYRVQSRVVPVPDVGGPSGTPPHGDLSSVNAPPNSSNTPSAIESVSGLYTPTHLVYNPQSYKPDQELSSKVRRACERISENVHICANEPSLAFYRLAEHVRKALPPTVESRVQVKRLHQQLLGVYYDAEYGLESVKNIEGASTHLSNVQELLKNSIFLQQQIKYENAKSSKKGTDLSMYQRLSAHLTSVDLPQLDLLDSISRETKSRVETFTFAPTQQSNPNKNIQSPHNIANTSQSNLSSGVIAADKSCPS